MCTVVVLKIPVSSTCFLTPYCTFLTVWPPPVEQEEALLYRSPSGSESHLPVADLLTSIHAQVEADLMTSIHAQVEADLLTSIHAQVEADLMTSMHAQVEADLLTSLHAQGLLRIYSLQSPGRG